MARAVERVRHGSRQLARRVARQLRIGIEGDDVFHPGQHRGLAHHLREAMLRAAAQQGIELRLLAALALVAHPEALSGIPAARPVKQEEAAAAVFAGQRLNALDGESFERRVLRQRFRLRIGEIGQQAEMQVRVAIGEEAHFQRLEQVLDLPGASQQGRHHRQRARVRRDSSGIVKPRQRTRCRERHSHAVHQRHGELAGGEQRNQDDEQQPPAAHPVGMRVCREAPGEEARGERERSQIKRQRKAAKAHSHAALELRQAFVDEVVAHMRAARVAAGLRQRDSLPRHIGFGEGTAFRHPFDRVPVAVAAGEVHRGVHGILAQRALDHAHRLDELAPVGRAQQAQAADAVAHRDLVGSLLLGFGLHQLLDGRTGFGKPLLDPGERQCERGALPLQPARQLSDERAHHRRVRARHVGNHQDQALRVLRRHRQHLVGPGASAVALGGGRDEARRHAPQVLEQCKAQHDRDRPELAELQRRDRLVRRHEAAQAFKIHAAIAVRNGLDRDVVHARQARGRAVQQARQLAAVGSRQVPFGGADLLFDQVEVIEQPLAGRRDAVAGGSRRFQQIAGADQDRFVVAQPREQPVARACRAPPVRPRQGSAVLLHLVGAVQLRAQGRLGIGPHLALSAARTVPVCALTNRKSTQRVRKSARASSRRCARR